MLGEWEWVNEASYSSAVSRRFEDSVGDWESEWIRDWLCLESDKATMIIEVC